MEMSSSLEEPLPLSIEVCTEKSVTVTTILFSNVIEMQNNVHAMRVKKQKEKKGKKA